MQWIFFIVIFIGSFFYSPAPALADDFRAPKVALSSAQNRVTAPKSLLSCVFVVTNSSRKKDTFNLKAVVPDGWQVISSLSPVNLRPRESRMLPVTVSVPSSALANDGYEVSLIAFSAANPEFSTKASCSVTISARARFKIIPPQPEVTCYPGQNINYVFTVINLGNAKDNLEFSATSAHKEKVDLSLQSLELGIGEQGKVIATVHVPLGVSEGTKHVLTLRAGSGLLEKGVFEEVSVYTPISGKRIAKDEGFYRSLPSQAVYHLSGIGTGESLSSQAEFYTGGRLNNEYWTNFAYQGPYYKNKENFRGLAKEIYTLNYGNNLWDIGLGDVNVNLSELTVLSLYERGEKFNIQKGPLSATAFNLRNKQGGFTEDSVGGKFTAKLGKVSEVGINYFESKENKYDLTVSRSAENKKMSSVQLSNKFRDFSLNGEYANGSSSSGSAKNLDHAWRVNSSLKQEKFYLSGEYVDAGPDYPGLRKDYQGYRSYLAWRFLKPLWLWNYSEKYHNNLDADPTRTRDNNQVLEFGSSFSAKNFPYLSLSYRLHNTKSKLNSVLTADSDENVYTLKTNKSFGRFSVSFDSKFTRAKDSVAGVDSKVYDYMGRIYKYGKKIDGWVGYGYNQAIDGIADSKTTLLRWEAGLIYQPSAKFNSSLSFSQEANKGQKASDILNVSASYTPWEDYNLSIEGEMRNDRRISEQQEWKFWLTLKTWFDLLLPVRINGILEIHAFVDENNNGRHDSGEAGVNQLTFKLDDYKSTTNKAGRCKFTSIVPGQYQFNIDISSLDLSLIPRMKLPLSLNISRGRLLKLEIPLLRAARASGLVYEDSNKDAKHDAQEKGAALVRVLLVSGASFIRDTFSDASGNYSFAGVPPQKCVIKIDQAWLPARYVITTAPERALELKPGEQVTGIDFGILEKEKQVITTYSAPEVKVIRTKRKGTLLMLLFFSALTAGLAYFFYRKLRFKSSRLPS